MRVFVPEQEVEELWGNQEQRNARLRKLCAKGHLSQADCNQVCRSAMVSVAKVATILTQLEWKLRERRADCI